MNRPRLIRGLRIAWSVWWGILCVLSIGLWVRSYWWMDNIVCGSAGRVEFSSWRGSVGCLLSPDWTALWKVNTAERTSFAMPVTPAIGLPNGFCVKQFTSAIGVSAPYWFLFVSTASLAVAPWIRRSFSLRTFLIAITLIAVVLGLVVWCTR